MTQSLREEVARYIKGLGAIPIEKKIRLARFRFSASLVDVVCIIDELLPEEKLPKEYKKLINGKKVSVTEDHHVENASQITRERNLWKDPHFKSVYNKFYMRSKGDHEHQSNVLEQAVYEYLHEESAEPRAKKTKRRVEYMKVEELIDIISEHKDAYIQIGRKLASTVTYDEKKDKVIIL